MPAYLVRLKDGDEEHARELVGIFVAETMEDLYWTVDEAASPCECECLELGPGGIHWERYTEQRVPRNVEPHWDGLPDGWSILPPTPTLTDEWSAAFEAEGVSATAEWKPIVWEPDGDDVPQPSEPPAPPHTSRALSENVLPFRRGRRSRTTHCTVVGAPEG